MSNWESTSTSADRRLRCTISPIPLAFTTNTNTVFIGDAFDAASSPPVNGAISDDWASLPPGTGAGCGLINCGDQRAGRPVAVERRHAALVRAAAAGSSGDDADDACRAKKKKKCKKKKKKGKSASAAAKKCKKKKKK